MNSQHSDKLIDGKAAAAQVIEEVAAEVATLKAEGLEPALAVVLIGDDPASHVYVRNKVLRAEQAGIRSLEFRMQADSSAEAVLEMIAGLNADPRVHGILVQLPLPAHIDERLVLQAIDPAKDVDGFHSDNVGGLSQGRPVLTPCTPAGCMRLLRDQLGELAGKHAVVVGRSNIVGKPMAALLLAADCSVTVLHSRSREPQALSRQADILIAAVGRPRMIDAAWIKPGAVVIDVGINRIEEDGRTRLVGDVDFDSVLPLVSAITPVPGGVGPMTIALLMQNTVTAARQQRKQAAARSAEESTCLSTC
ncbi:TPA: bifunctional methylenetetrahydrofolate dehydrogenase/methenyltetrahydrofolate cyclohydrolase FolD [Pseudomonas aeruginosa]|uniref:bifunctional methylenetetrahydrofolate dehydrogenase/methenyltetrahydrofolate cyclohydrolase FolD n=1 Tax=Pseudomonas TaxID=286 RepID=UPI00071B2E0B|nr:MULTISPECIES: bifunctional methylenetetrahydrofolate dehydrogenase/methenyltetrahydrofolate cyclohydrolase FolD [Pseudomonas]KSJ48833.1 bifunctional methylenetetrahydrofolate dehydrogenase/methenyltetrahydrofolate cyclohydrolase [Pseudomonas aeruginosa]MBG5794059.1 bifunctional methylenetetrahydrofolate dehydrogenase/methenyltetrahydrofolate cyclohydrolase FolD [Pseudomonas aeruginosa]MBG6378945.1 bifunctional methylenetetrahydrofolate dehydrogenase/methenyltetrahydrofolate cyclohydrolase Fol